MSENIPAVIRKVPDWTVLSLSKNFGVLEDKLLTRVSANISHARHEILNVDGEDVQLLRIRTQLNAYKDAEQLASLFGEVVTRADGSTATLLQLLDGALTAFAAEAQNNPESQNL